MMCFLFLTQKICFKSLSMIVVVNWSFCWMMEWTVPTGSGLGPPCPALKANPFPKVKDPYCRLPLPILFYRSEAVHLENLMCLWVRPGVDNTRSFEFSRVAEDALDTMQRVVLFQPLDPTSYRVVSRVARLLNRKDNSSQFPADIFGVPNIIVNFHVPVQEF